MDPRSHSCGCFVLVLILATPIHAQTLDWAATFDDFAAGYESPRSAALSPTGELHILADHSDGMIYFRVSPGGQTVRETRFTVPNGTFSMGPVIDQSGGAYLAQNRYGLGDEPDFAILRLGENDEQWTLGIYEDPDDRDNLRHALVVDAAGNAIVAGASWLTSATMSPTSTARTC